MPELPEVEHVRRSLHTVVSGRRILTAELLRERLAPDTPPTEFARKLGRTTILAVRRRGKHILLDLDNDLSVIVHLRMSGKFQLFPSDRENPKFTHAVFYFSDETRLIFSDQRHFGFMRIIETDQVAEAKELKKLAPEPFSEEFSAKYLSDVLKNSSRKLKDVMLDQTKVCGLGNIYAAEALFLAGLSPRLSSKRVSARAAGRLHQHIREVLAESIDHSSSVPIDPENIDGGFYGGLEDRWRVYDREGEQCVMCGELIKRIKQAGRSSYFCPKCQK